MQAPVLPAAFGFALGVAIAQLCWRPPVLLLIAILLASLLTWFSSRRSSLGALASVLLLFTLTGALCAELAPHPSAENFGLLAQSSHQNRTGRRAAGMDRIEGMVTAVRSVRQTESVEPYSTKVRIEHSQTVQLRDVRIRGVPLPGDFMVQLTAYAPVEQPPVPLHCGDRLEWTGRLRMPAPYRDPGVWNSVEYLRQQGIGAVASVARPQLEMRGNRRLGWRLALVCRLHAWQQNSAQRLTTYADSPRNLRMAPGLRLSREDASMLTAMVTGDRTYLGGATRIGFERTGSFHLLVVSGLHLAIFSGLVFWAAQRLHLARLGATLVTLAVSAAYAMFTGFGQPVQRSLWMISLYLITRLAWREKQSINAVAVASLAMLAIRPAALWDTGFQMTVLAVFAVAGLTVPILERSFGPYHRALSRLAILRIDASLPPPIAQFRVTVRMVAMHLSQWVGRRIGWMLFPAALRFLLRCCELVVVSAAMEVAMAIPMATSFHRVTVTALPVNLLIVPLIGVLLPVALSSMATVLAAPAIAPYPVAATASLLHFASWTVHLFGAARWGEIRIPEPQPWQISVSAGLLTVALFTTSWNRLRLTLSAALLAISLAVLYWPRSVRHDPGACEITAIDVGQGDSLLVITPQGRTLLIDAGGLVGESPDARFNMGEDVVSPVLWSRGIRRLDAVAITHAHLDHIGGMAAVLSSFRPAELWIGKNPHSATYDALLREAASLQISVRQHLAGEQFSFGGVQASILAPRADYVPAATPGNNDSLVMRLQFGTTSVLLEGDAEAPSEARMVVAGNLHSDLLKVGHHGSRTSTTPAFLAAVAPHYAAVSVGRDNFYGHPRQEVLEELQQAKIRTYRTDMEGLTTFLLDGSKVSVEP